MKGRHGIARRVALLSFRRGPALVFFPGKQRHAAFFRLRGPLSIVKVLHGIVGWVGIGKTSPLNVVIARPSRAWTGHPPPSSLGRGFHYKSKAPLLTRTRLRVRNGVLGGNLLFTCLVCLRWGWGRGGRGRCCLRWTTPGRARPGLWGRRPGLSGRRRSFVRRGG